MTRKEAQAEAQRRWGPEAYVKHRRSAIHRRTRTMFLVGVRQQFDGLNPLNAAVAKGSGDSWEAAFRDADARSSR